jgi:hypothetical protein
VTPFLDEVKEAAADKPLAEWEPSYAAAFDVYWKCVQGAVLVHADGKRCDFKPRKRD